MNYYVIKKILVPVDLSETSLNALETAIVLAKKHNAVLQLLNVAEQLPDPADNNRLAIFPNDINQDVLNALIGTIIHVSNIQPQLIRKQGHVTGIIITTSVHEQTDLVIMGTHGASGVREGFIGSNTYGVIKHSSCPVLTIPPERKFTSFKNVMFPIRPVNGALKRFDVVSHFMDAGSSLGIMGLSYQRMQNDTGILDKIAEEIREEAAQSQISVTTAWGEGASVSENILGFSQRSRPDLIVLTSALDAIVKPNFIGPHTQKLINNSRVPLLSIKKNSVPAFA